MKQIGEIEGRSGPSWPDIFIVGAQKAATTTLYRWLGEHPDIFMSPTKEPHFFSRLRERQENPPEHLVSEPDTYLALFEPARQGQLTGEASTSYLYHPDVPERIHARNPDAHIVISLRDPIARAHSHYLMDHRLGRAPGTFREAVETDLGRPRDDHSFAHRYVHHGRYAEPVRRYRGIFGEDQITICLFRDLQRAPGELLRSLFESIGVDPAVADEIDTGASHNAYRAPRSDLLARLRGSSLATMLSQTLLTEGVRDRLRQNLFVRDASKPDIEADVLQQLVTVYEPDVQRLEDQLDGPLDELRGSWG